MFFATKFANVRGPNSVACVLTLDVDRNVTATFDDSRSIVGDWLTTVTLSCSVATSSLPLTVAATGSTTGLLENAR